MPTASAPTPSLLLTKRLTSFLRSNLSAQIHTAALTTLSGKLLAHASPHSVGTLRTQCTVAASIWALYSAPTATTALTDALPSQYPPTQPELTSSAVTIQLTGGVMVIRRLRCGLLFVCIGPITTPDGADHGSQAQAHHQQTRPMPTAQPASSPSEVESVASAGAATTASVATTTSVAASAVVVTRRQAEELARWLDDRLGSLGVLEEGIGIDPL
ncbi:hypothetical protein AAE478_007796 [Parahypoxylon ruwenzoriense]